MCTPPLARLLSRRQHADWNSTAATRSPHPHRTRCRGGRCRWEQGPRARCCCDFDRMQASRVARRMWLCRSTRAVADTYRRVSVLRSHTSLAGAPARSSSLHCAQAPQEPRVVRTLCAADLEDKALRRPAAHHAATAAVTAVGMLIGLDSGRADGRGFAGCGAGRNSRRLSTSTMGAHDVRAAQLSLCASRGE